MLIELVVLVQVCSLVVGLDLVSCGVGGVIWWGLVLVVSEIGGCQCGGVV